MKNLPIPDFCDEVYILLYGEKSNINELRKIKSNIQVLNDIVIYLAKDDILKIEEVKNITFIEAMDFLQSKVDIIKANRVKVKQPKVNPIGFKKKRTTK